MEKDNIIFIGKKPIMKYVGAAQISLRENNEIKICARGKTISKAIDIAEMIKGRFMKEEVEEVSIKTKSEDFDSEHRPGKKVTVSSIEITLKLK